jgi:pimeloyl-ACP methyl ester carboxylesterase
MPLAGRAPARDLRRTKLRRDRSHPASRRPRVEGPRRLLLRGLVALLIILVALTLASLAVAWYASGQLMAVRHVHDTYPLRVVATDAAGHTVVLSRGPYAAEPGSFRLAWPSGQAVVGTIVAATPATVTRRVSSIRGRLAAGQRAGVEPALYTGDPDTALRLPFTGVRVAGELVEMPAWFVAGRRHTWVILVHGLGGSRADVLPPMRILHQLGYPMLAISYRNDVDAPRSPDGHEHLGDTEWHDLSAAIDYAVGNGASGVVLYGYSMGGSMALTAARDPTEARYVRAVVLDSPVLDWPPTLGYAADRHGIPPLFTKITETLLAWRDHLDWGRLDQLAHERELTAPVLLFQGSADTVVPPSLAEQFARRRPTLVTYRDAPGAGHAASIDTEPAMYRHALGRLLAGYR